MYLTPEQDARRFEILGFDIPKQWFGGVFQFDSMTAEMGRTLIAEGLMDPEGATDCSPTNENFVQFMELHPGFVAHGYIVSAERRDVRVSIEGIEFEGYPERELIFSFVDMFHYADGFEISNDGLYCWFD